MLSNTGKGLVALGIVGAFTIPIFRSGGNTGLTFVSWVVNHTVFGPAVEYIPAESYQDALCGGTLSSNSSPITRNA